MHDAVVITGSVLKGAFAAGALSVLTDPVVKAAHGINIREVYGTSSGALNGAYLATSIRQGDEADCGKRLSAVWIDKVHATNIFSLSTKGILGLRGICDMRKLIKLMRALLTAKPGREAVSLHMTVADLQGRMTGLGTCHELAMSFSGNAFDTESGLDAIRSVAAASASVPGLFVPFQLRAGGRVVEAADGGLVNDTPLLQALRSPEVQRVFIIDAYPLQLPGVRPAGFSLIGQLLRIITQERLVRDLTTAYASDKKIVQIRPSELLPGGDLSGAFSRRLRQQYVGAGALAAGCALRGDTELHRSSVCRRQAASASAVM